MVLRFVLSLVLVLASSVAAQNTTPLTEYHLREDGLRHLYAASPFAHGHRHGYEAGYRAADQEIHLGGRQHELRNKDIPKDMDYRREYGEKSQFRQGFQFGFRAGYSDSYAERHFRVPDWSQAAPLFSRMDLPQSDAPMFPDKRTLREFDSGVARGYIVAQGGEDPEDEVGTVARRAAASCATEADDARTPYYCDGYVQGFLVGTEDRRALGGDRRAAAVGHVP